MAEGNGDKTLRKIAEAFKDLANVVTDSQSAEVKVSPFSHACSLVSPLFGCLGVAFKFAEMDYVAKVNDLVEASKCVQNLQSLIELDVQANTVRKGGSHTRNLLRVKRGLDMVRVLFEQILVTDCYAVAQTSKTLVLPSQLQSWTIF
uniref:Glycolipid transfer protein domain-containing protein n=1 Tax=Glycine max TaxID=3847 RepID=A0A0R0I8Q8_SOYBN